MALSIQKLKIQFIDESSGWNVFWWLHQQAVCIFEELNLEGLHTNVMLSGAEWTGDKIMIVTILLYKLEFMKSKGHFQVWLVGL